MDLFAGNRQKNLDKAAPLAARMRPRTLDEFAGQQHGSIVKKRGAHGSLRAPR